MIQWLLVLPPANIKQNLINSTGRTSPGSDYPFKTKSVTKQHKTELFPPFTLSEFDVFGWKASAAAPFDQ